MAISIFATTRRYAGYFISISSIERARTPGKFLLFTEFRFSAAATALYFNDSKLIQKLAFSFPISGWKDLVILLLSELKLNVFTKVKTSKKVARENILIVYTLITYLYERMLNEQDFCTAVLSCGKYGRHGCTCRGISK